MKLAYDKAIAGQRGYTPFKTEIAKGADHHDLKEFWHVGRDSASMLPNIWPDTVPEFKATFHDALCRIRHGRCADIVVYRDLSGVACRLVRRQDRKMGNSILRLLHYPPIEGDTEGCIRAGAHEDINLDHPVA